MKLYLDGHINWAKWISLDFLPQKLLCEAGSYFTCTLKYRTPAADKGPTKEQPKIGHTGNPRHTATLHAPRVRRVQSWSHTGVCKSSYKAVWAGPDPNPWLALALASNTLRLHKQTGLR